MAYIQSKLPQPVKDIPFAITNFTGGLCNILDETLIADNQTPDTCNMDITEDGVIRSRGGFTVIENIFNETVTFADMFNPTYSEPRNVTFTSTKVYIDGVVLIDNTTPISGLQFNNKYYVTTGTNVYIIGKFPQELSAHVKPWGTPVADEIALKLVAPPSGFTPLDATNTIGMYHYDYTNLTCWYEPCQNELDDEFKGVNVIPTSPTYFEIHKERLFIVSDLEDPGALYLTDINNGMYFPATLGLHIPPTGDRITGITLFTDSIVVGTNSNIYVIYGDTNRTDVGTQYNIKRVNTHTGFKNNNTIQRMYNNLIYLGSDMNIYSMYTTKTDVDLLLTSTLNRQVNFKKYPINATVNDMIDTHLVYSNNVLYLLIPSIKTILTYSYTFKAFMMYKTVLDIKYICINNGELNLYDVNGKRYNINEEQYSDDGNLYKHYWSSKRMSFNDATLYKKFREMFVVAHVFDNARSDIKITYEIDYLNVNQEEIIKNQKSLWGVTLFGDRFIDRNIAPSLPINIGQRGRFIKFTVYSGYWLEGTVTNYAQLLTVPRHNMVLYYVEDENIYYQYILGQWVKREHIEVKQPVKVYGIHGTFQVKGRR